MRAAVRRAKEAEATRKNEPWGSACWLAGKQIGNADGVVVGHVVIKPGHANPRHSHPTSEEVLYVLQGRVEHSVDDEKVILEPGDTIVVPKGVVHDARNVGQDDVELMVAFSSGVRDVRLESATTC